MNSTHYAALLALLLGLAVMASRIAGTSVSKSLAHTSQSTVITAEHGREN